MSLANFEPKYRKGTWLMNKSGTKFLLTKNSEFLKYTDDSGKVVYCGTKYNPPAEYVDINGYKCHVNNLVKVY